jgi:cytosine/uracil/thiamine/allantoin permease
LFDLPIGVRLILDGVLDLLVCDFSVACASPAEALRAQRVVILSTPLLVFLVFGTVFCVCEEHVYVITYSTQHFHILSCFVHPKTVVTHFPQQTPLLLSVCS